MNHPLDGNMIAADAHYERSDCPHCDNTGSRTCPECGNPPDDMNDCGECGGLGVVGCDCEGDE